MPKINFGDSPGGFEALPEMVAKAVLSNYAYKPANTDQTINVNMEFTIQVPEDYLGRKVFRTFNTKPNALWAIKQGLKNMQVAPALLEGEVELDDILPELRGSAATLRITRRQYQGKTTNDVEIIDPDTDPGTASPTAW